MRPSAAPTVCVWEITLACNAACVHCGSRAGPARPDELDAREALELCDALADLGTREVTLSGGEPLLRPDWPEIAGRLAARGVRVDVISNGLALDDAAAKRMAEAGVAGATLSIDGDEAVHDELRGTPGGFRAAMRAARRLIDRGLPVGAVTQVNRRNIDRLSEVEALLAAAGFGGWQIQLTAPLGRGADRPDLLLPPSRVPEVIGFVLAAGRRGRIPVQAADNVGWMLRGEPEIRSLRRPTDRFFHGCAAGLSVIGVTSSGVVRGCLSMPADLDEGSLRERSLADLWADPDA
jgi:MoaA/NifB/PqqE/SkfB family radical SAM enzyme